MELTQAIIDEKESKLKKAEDRLLDLQLDDIDDSKQKKDIDLLMDQIEDGYEVIRQLRIQLSDKEVPTQLEQLYQTKITLTYKNNSSGRSRVFRGMSMLEEDEKMAIQLDMDLKTFDSLYKQMSKTGQTKVQLIYTEVVKIKKDFDVYYAKNKALKVTENKGSVTIGTSGDIAKGETKEDGRIGLNGGMTVEKDKVVISGGGKTTDGTGIGGKLTLEKDKIELSGVVEKDGVIAGATIGTDKFGGLVGLKMKPKTKEFQMPFMVGPVPLFVGIRFLFGLQVIGEGSATKIRDPKSKEVTDYSRKLAVTVTATAAINVDTGFKPAVCEIGVTLGGTAVGTLKGEATWTDKDTAYELYGGVDVNTSAAVFIRAPKEIREIAEKVGFAHDSLSFEVKFGELKKLLVMTGVSYKKLLGGGQDINWAEIERGPGYYKLEAAVKAAYDELMENIEKVQQLWEDTKDSVGSVVYDVTVKSLKIDVDKDSYKYGSNMTVEVDLELEDDDWIGDDNHYAELYIGLYHEKYGDKPVIEEGFEFNITHHHEKNYSIQIPANLDKKLDPESWDVNVWIKFNDNNKQKIEKNYGDFDIYPE